MKKFILMIAVALATTISALAVNVTVVFNNGQSIEDTLVEQTDTTLVITPYYTTSRQDLTIRPERVKYFAISSLGRYYTEDGKFVPSKEVLAKMDKYQAKQRAREERNRALAANPNEVIGKAFKSTGSVCIGIGVPSALVGAILVGVGNAKPDLTNKKPEEIAAATEARGRCAAAGYVLLPMGAALTIVGIPLYAHGKRIAELNFNYTGNGAGLSFNF